MELITLTAKRVPVTKGHYKGFYETQFYKPDGSLYATIPVESKQPRKDKKTITLNCWKWNIKWLPMLLFIVLVTVESKGQLGVGGGIGILDTNGMAVQLKVDYTFRHIGVQAGFITAPSPSAPCYFNVQVNPVIKINNSTYLFPHGGYVYRLVSNDRKELNGQGWIAGITLENGVFDRGILYLDASVINGKSFAFTIGLKGLFGTMRTDCN